MLHANVGSDQTLTFECTALPDRLRINVTDPGSRLEPQLRAPDRDAGGGYGLRIVEVLSSAWGVVRSTVGATSVWCDLPLETVSVTGTAVPSIMFAIGMWFGWSGNLLNWDAASRSPGRAET